MNKLHTMLLATSALVAATVAGSAAQAGGTSTAGGPAGGKVVVGSATITSPNSTETLVDQTSNSALINWNSFSIPTGSSVVFEQPGKTSLTVNRVTGPNASTIDGDLLANGNVWILNANGILFGRGSEVNVGALIATTSDLTDNDFRNGKYRFTKPGNANASVVNQGTITAGQNGSVVLSASRVSNEGIISANLGTVVLGGAKEFTVDLDGDNLLRYQITAPVSSAPKTQKGETAAALVSNSGTIQAAGGRVLLTARAAQNVQDDVINNSGNIEATSVSSHNGEIDLDAGPDGTVEAGGTINASGDAKGEKGGKVDITGGTVDVENGATINASGDAGGGKIDISSGTRTKAAIATTGATNSTNIGDATIDANALVHGRGGQISIWSSGTTNLDGKLSATGGALSGKGGRVDTSGGVLNLGAGAFVSTLAPKGTTGDWVIDPTNIVIETGATGGINGSDISPTTIIDALGTTSVELKATNDITIDSEVDYSSANTFSLLAGQDIIANAGIQNSGTGNINLVAGWDGETTNPSQFTNSGVYGNNNGSITIGGVNAVGDVAIGSAGGTTTLAAAHLTLDSENGNAQVGYHGAGGGDIDIDLAGGLTLIVNVGEGGNGTFAQIGNGSLAGDVQGNITGNISINARGTTTINVGEGGNYNAWIGNFANEGYSESGSVTLLTGSISTANFDLGQNLIADLGSASAAGSGGNVTLGLTDSDLGFGLGSDYDYDSPNNLTLLSTGNIYFNNSVQNAGSGNITAVAGWNGITIDPSQLTSPGVYGNNSGAVFIGGEGYYNDIEIGSAVGTTTIAAASLDMESSNEAYSQIGYHGSGGGNITVDTTGDVYLVANAGEGGGSGFAQIGNGSPTMSTGASGNITLNVGGSLDIQAATNGGFASIGNGSLDPGAAGNVTGNITINVAGATNLDGYPYYLGSIGIGNIANAPNGYSETGNVSLISGTINDNSVYGTIIPNIIYSDIAGGDVTFGVTDGSFYINPVHTPGSFTSSHNLTILASNDLSLDIPLVNNGTGDITLVAGWNPSVAPANVIAQAAYGNSGSITIGPNDSDCECAVGSFGGTTTIAGDNITLYSGYDADRSYLQIGYPGAGIGNINVLATGDLTLWAYGPTAQIGNGALYGTGDSTSGNVTGNINIDVGGSMTFNEYGGPAWIGNVAGGGNIESGNVTLIAGSFSMPDNVDFGQNLIADLGTTGQPSSGGNVTVGLTSNDINFGIGSDYDYSSPNNLTLLSTGNIFFDDSVQNAGSGNITAIAGWDGATTNPSRLTNSGVYGNNGESIYVGGAGAYGNVAVGSAGGMTTLAAANLTVESDNGYAQIGYHGAGGGNIVVDLTNDLTLTVNVGEGGGTQFAQIGNGSFAGDVSGNITGGITLKVGGTTAINVGEGAPTAWIGNAATEGYSESGDVTLITGNVSGSNSNPLGQMLVADLGTTSQPGSGGNVLFGLTDPQTDFINTYLGTGAVEYNSPNSLTLLSTGNITLPYSIQNDGNGALTILAGWDGHTLSNFLTTAGSFGNITAQESESGECADNASSCGAFIWVVGANGSLADYNPGADGGTIAVDSGAGTSIGSAGGATTVGAAQVYVEGLSAYAQIGYHGSGTGSINVIANGIPGTGGLTGIGACFDGNANICVLGGRSGDSTENDSSYAQIGDLGLGVEGTSSANIDVSATGNISIAGGGIYNTGTDPEISNAYGMIGNGDGAATVGQTVSGNISITAAGQLNLASSTGRNSYAWVGNRTGVGGLASGNLTVVVGSEDDSGPVTFGDMINYDLGTTSQPGSGGNVVVGITDSDAVISSGAFTYNSPNNLTILSVDDVDVRKSLLNLGSGDITLVAGWNSSVAPDHVLTAADAYGLNNGKVTIGGANATGAVAVGTVSGTTTVLTDSLDVESDNGFAQLGYAGAGSGNIDVVATGGVTVDALNGTFALIGNGSTSGTPAAGGTITVNSGGDVLVEADTHNGVAAIGNVSTGTQSGDVSVTTAGGSVTVDGYGQNSIAVIGDASIGSTTGGVSGNTTIETNGGDLDITAATGQGATAAVGALDASFGETSTGASGNVYVNTSGGTVSLTSSGVGTAALLGTDVFSGLGTESGTTTVDAGALTITSNGTGSDAWLGGVSNSAGNAGGTVTVNASTVSLESDGSGGGDQARILIGGAGSISGNIDVTTTGNISLDGTDGDFSSIGYRQAGDGTATGTITVQSGGTLTLTAEDSGQARIASSGAPDNNINVTAVGKISLFVTGTADEGGNSGLALIGNIADATTAAGGNITVTSTLGQISLSDSETGALAMIGNDAGAGTPSGNVKVVTDSATHGIISLTSGGGAVQIGNGGGSGNVTVNAGSDVTVRTTGVDGFAEIGNGGSDIAGNVGGNITVSSGGNILVQVDGPANGGVATIGNDSTGSQSGTIGITTSGGSLTVNSFASLDDSDNRAVAFIGNGSLVATEGGATGDITINTGSGAVDLTASGDLSQAWIGDGVIFHEGGTTGGNIDITAGSISLEANESDDDTSQARIANRGDGEVIGNYDIVTTGDIDLDATNGNLAAIGHGQGGSGTSTGTLTVQSGGNISLTAENSGETRIGNDSATDSNVNVTAAGNILLQTSGGGGLGGGDLIGDIGGSLTGGNITVTSTGGDIDMEADSPNSIITVGNVANGASDITTGNVKLITDSATNGTITLNSAGTGTVVEVGDGGDTNAGAASGNITITGADGVLLEATGTNASAQIGNGGLGYVGDTSGQVSVTGSNPVYGVELLANAPGTYLQIGNGGTGASGTDSGTVGVSAPVGEVYVSLNNAGSTAMIGNGGSGASGATSGNVSVSSTNSDIEVSVIGDGVFQIGNGGFQSNGSASGNITLTAGGDIGLTTATGGLAGSGTGIQIGDGGYESNLNAVNGFTDSGNISLTANNITLETTNGSSFIIVGNGGDCVGATGGACGTSSNVATTNGSVGFGGNVTIAAANSLSLLADSTGAVWIGNGGDYSAEGMNIQDGTLSESGNINVTVGSNSAAGTLTLQVGTPGAADVHIGNGGLDAGYQATASGGLTMGGNIVVDVLGGDSDAGSIELNGNGTGSASNVTIGNNGYYLTNGTIGGTAGITVDGNLTLVSTSNSVAFIGNESGASDTSTGAVTIDAVTLTNNGSSAYVLGNSAEIDLTGEGAGIGSSDAALNVDVKALAVQAEGDVYINSPFGGVSLGVGEDGTNVGNSSFVLTAAGLVTQSQSIDAGNLSITTTSGAITLTNTGNQFGTAYVSTQGSSNASLYDASDLTISGADVGGTLVLTGGGTIGQSGAITANALDATTTNGAITLTNTGNEVNSADFSTQNSDDASFYDASDLTITGANVGGTLTLTGGGTIGQSGAIAANTLDVTTTNGAITLTKGGNQFGTASISTQNADDASLTDASDLTIASATVGGTLTLTGAGTIGQSGAISSSALDVSTTNGAITLTNTGNEFGTANVATRHTDDASIYDASNLTISGATVGGTLTLAGGGTIGQSGAIAASTLDVTTTNGAITLTNSGNQIGTANISTQNSDDASLSDATNLTISGATVGGTLTLTGGGTIGQSGAIAANTLDVSTSNGAITLTNTGNQFGIANVSTQNSDNASIYDASNLTISGANVGGTLALNGGGTIGQSGAITANALDATTTNGSITLTNTGNEIGSADFSTQNSDDASFYDVSDLTITGANVGGTLTLNGGGTIGQSGVITATTLDVSTTNGAITLTNTGNEFGIANVSTQNSDNASIYDASNLTISGANVGGTLTLAGGGTIGQSGAITASALDATTTNGSITLTNTDNEVGSADFSTQNSDDASFYDASDLTITGANVGGTLTLNGGGTIGQSGAIAANTLEVTTTNGAITLTNSVNRIGTANISTQNSDDASLSDASDLTIASATVGGTLTLAGGGTIGQSGAITASALDVSTTNGAITLTNTGNQFGIASVSTQNSDDASIYDASNLTISGANVGGTLALTGAGTIGQSGAITANALNVTTTNGAITLTNTGNQVGSADFSTQNSDDASLYDASDLTITGATVGGTLTLTGGGTIGQSGAISANTLGVTTTNGAVTLMDSENQIGTANISTQNSDDASLSDATNLTISGATVGGTLTLNGDGTIGQSGAIAANTLDVTTTNGAITLTNAGNQFTTASLSTQNTDNASLYDASDLTISGATVGGTLTLNGSGNIGQSGAITANTLDATSTNGAITLTNGGNQIANASLQASGEGGGAALYDTGNLVISNTQTSGNLTLLATGGITFVTSTQSTDGSLIAVAGWDGETTNPSSLTSGSAYGNNDGSIIVGGSNAAGGVFVGGANGTTIAGDNVSLEATNGFAQIGIASGSDAITVVAGGNVALSGGGSSNEYAQIGNGGYQSTGNESGAITVTAAGNVTLTGGGGQDAYAQIGHGGADSNSSGEGSYSDTGLITVSGETVSLGAGNGTGAYAQIGHGGYLAGQDLNGTATLGLASDTIDVSGPNGVTLTGGGAEAYAMIGNGGDMVNSNAANGANGSIDANINVTAPGASVSLTAGSGADSFAQVGNGGRGENTPAAGATVSFTIGGNISISDLTLTGSDTGADGYAQVGNGDASKTGYGNVSGDVTIGPGIDVTVVNGTAPGTDSMIGNDTGTGSVTGSISGYTSPTSGISDPGTTGTVESTQNSTNDQDTSVTTVNVTPEAPPPEPSNNLPNTPAPTPLDVLAGNGSGSEGKDPTDDLTNDLSQSLDPTTHKVAVITTKAIIPGVLTEIVFAQGSGPHGVPPVDQDYSSWGNEALWEW